MSLAQSVPPSARAERGGAGNLENWNAGKLSGRGAPAGPQDAKIPDSQDSSVPTAPGVAHRRDPGSERRDALSR